MRRQIYGDIYDDSMWLINLVENLLAVTRIEEGRLNLRITEDLMDDVITEALHHINRKSEEHHISVESKEEFLLAKMDAKLIVQVSNIHLKTLILLFGQKSGENKQSYLYRMTETELLTK